MQTLKTFKKGDKITKVCVEDMYKMINRILEVVDDSVNNIYTTLDSFHKTFDGSEGELIIGVGRSKPCGEDQFDETTGNEIAFKKAKLHANVQKIKFLQKLTKQLDKMSDAIYKESTPIYDYIWNDVQDLRKYNPDYMTNEVHEI